MSDGSFEDAQAVHREAYLYAQLTALRDRTEAAEAERDAAVADAAAYRDAVCDLLESYELVFEILPEPARGVVVGAFQAVNTVGKAKRLLSTPHPGAGLLEALRAKDEALRALSATVVGFGGRLIYHDDPRMTRALAEIDTALSTTPAQAGERVARLERVAEAARGFVNRRGCMRCHGTGQAHVRYAALGISMNEADPDCPNCRSLRQALADMEVGTDASRSGGIRAVDGAGDA